MQKEFITIYRELKVESLRGAQAAYADTLYMGTRSKSRQRYEEKELGEIRKVEITTKTEKVDVMIEVEHSTEDITDHRKIDGEISHEI